MDPRHEITDKGYVLAALERMILAGVRRVSLCDERPIPDFPVNFAPGYRVITTLDDSKTVTFAESGAETTRRLAPGDFVFSRPHTWFSEHWDEPHTHLAIVCGADFVRVLVIEAVGGTRAGRDPIGRRVTYHTAHPASNASVQLLHALAAPPATNTARQTTLEALLFELRHQVRTDAETPAGSATFRWAIARSYIAENIETPLRRAHVAQAVGISTGYLSRLVREYSGLSFAEYVAGMKLERGRHLLRDSSYSVAEIARLVGFTDTDTFIRSFRRYEGTTPGRYRAAIL